MIPESSLPMGDRADATQKDYTDPAITSAGPGSTTAALAGQQPIEPRGTPQVVSKDSDTKKDDGISGKAVAGTAAAGVGVAGAAVGVNYLLSDDTDGANYLVNGDAGKGAVSAPTQPAQPAQDTGNVTGDAERTTASTVPNEVKESQKEADQPAEAAANAEAVKEKSEAEKELLSKVPETNAQGEPAPTDSAATATTVPTTTSDTGAPQLGDPVAGGLAPIKMDDKADSSTNHERDISPGTKPTGAQTQPIVTTGVGDQTTSQTSTPQTPQTQKSAMDKMKTYGTPESESSTPGSTSKKDKRRSFLKRLKDKLS